MPNGWDWTDKRLGVIWKAMLLLGAIGSTSWGAANFAVNATIDSRTGDMRDSIAINTSRIRVNADSLTDQQAADSAVADQIYRLSLMLIDLSEAIEADEGSVEERRKLQQMRRRIAIPSTRGGP